MSEGIKTPLLQKSSEPKKKVYLDVNPFSKLFFAWVTGPIKLGWKTPFQQDMHYDLRDDENTLANYRKFTRNWSDYLGSNNTIFRTLLKTYGGQFTLGLIISIISAILQFSNPYFIYAIVNYVQSPDQDWKQGVYLMVGVAISRVLMAIFQVQSSFVYQMLGVNMNSAMNAVIYDKALRFSIIRSKQHSVGSLVNNMQVDSQKLLYVSFYMSVVVVFPLELTIGIFILYYVVGYAFTSGMIIIVLMGIVNYINGACYFKLQKKIMVFKDERIKQTNEILSAIKYIKMSGWEDYFLEKVCKTRDQELSQLAKQFVTSCVTNFSLWLTPMLVTTSIFATYVWLGNDITSDKAFTVVSTFWVLQDPIRSFPRFITLMLEAVVALKRIQLFLKAEDVNTDYIEYNNDVSNSSEVAIKMTNGNFYWLDNNEKSLDMDDKQKKPTSKKAAKIVKVVEKPPSKNPETLPGDSRLTITSNLNDSRTNTNWNLTESKTADEESKEDLNGKLSHVTMNTVHSNERDAYKPIASELDPNDMILKNLSFEIKKGSFVAIIGDVASGKSSLLYSLIGEMKFDKVTPPDVFINGGMAYASQKPWILNDTVRNNILFGRQYDEIAYQNAVKYSCLESDLKILIKGDLTEIGEKGVNLSGGQKSRVSLARAIYSNRDIYLLDDPLSAVDAHVGRFILDECLLSFLSQKTRVLVTHNLDCLRSVDTIFIMQKGEIVEQGNYLEIEHVPIFKDIMQKTLQRQKSSHAEEEITTAIVPATRKMIDIEKEEPQKATEISDLKAVEENKGDTTIQGKSGIDAKDAKKKADADEPLMLAEDREVGVVSWDVYKAYIDYYGGICFFLVINLTMLIWVSLQTLSNFWLTHWTNSNDPTHNVFYLEVYALLALSYAFFSLFRVAIFFCRSIQCSRKIHRIMFTNILKAPISTFFDRVPIGRILNRFSKDLTVLDVYLVFSFGWFLVAAYGLLADIFVCFWVGTYVLIPCFIVFFIISMGVQRIYMRIYREIVRLESISRSPIVSFFSESLNGLTTIRGYQDQTRFFEKQVHNQNENTKNQVLSNALGSWFSLVVALASLFVVMPSVSICVLFSNYFGVNPGLAGLLVTYILFIDDDIVSFLAVISDLESKLISLERCLAFTKIPTEKETKLQTYMGIENFSKDWPSEGRIELQNYWVKYREALPFVLKNVNFVINPMEKVGIVGRTGSGKSTLFLTILRILEANQGKIFIDGVDISQVGLEDIRKKITIIPQDPVLFKGTIKENMDLLNEFKDEEIWHALEVVCMKEKFEKEKGLLTEIKGDGDNLSAGEKQLICIGRAILKKNKILLIDEATSNIDIRTEDIIITTIKEKLVGCTVLTIAHRLKTIISSDRLIVMKDGEAAEFDSPQNLLENHNSMFYSLWQEAQKENIHN